MRPPAAGGGVRALPAFLLAACALTPLAGANVLDVTVDQPVRTVDPGESATFLLTLRAATPGTVEIVAETTSGLRLSHPATVAVGASDSQVALVACAREGFGFHDDPAVVTLRLTMGGERGGVSEERVSLVLHTKGFDVPAPGLAPLLLAGLGAVAIRRRPRTL